jgi:hypothetical protein
MRMKFINAMLYVISSSYFTSELKKLLKKIQLAFVQTGNGQYFLGKMALSPLLGENFALIILTEMLTERNSDI